jgi:hypothetical protein
VPKQRPETGPFGRALDGSDHGDPRSALGNVVNVAFWHETDIQRLPGSGPLTGA